MRIYKGANVCSDAAVVIFLCFKSLKTELNFDCKLYEPFYITDAIIGFFHRLFKKTNKLLYTMS
jgi:hypothetical protein